MPGVSNRHADRRSRPLDVGGAGRLVGSPDGEDLHLLTEDLQTLKRNWALIHPGLPQTGSWVLAADRRTDYRVVRAVFAACAEAGFTNGQLLVSKTVPPWTISERGARVWVFGAATHASGCSGDSGEGRPAPSRGVPEGVNRRDLSLHREVEGVAGSGEPDLSHEPSVDFAEHLRQWGALGEERDGRGQLADEEVGRGRTVVAPPLRRSHDLLGRCWSEFDGDAQRAF